MRSVFAVVGDVHGHMRAMIDLVQRRSDALKVVPDFVLQVGDFEPHRDEADLETMAAPAKYRLLGEYHLFNEGACQFPWPIYFIGGNHEPYGYLDQIPDGGEITRNCFYLGRSGVLEIEGCCIAGLSGVSDQGEPRNRPPVSEIHRTSKKKYQYFSNQDVNRLLNLDGVDVLLLHEWPAGIYSGSRGEGAKRRTSRGPVGNEAGRTLIELLEPRVVFCGHMHWSYRSVVPVSDGREVPVHCLANVESGSEACSFYSVNEIGYLCELVLEDS